MYLETKISGILKRVGSTFDDGVGFELRKVADGVTEVGLTFTSDACAECVVPDAILESILLREIRKDLPMMRQVKVINPATKGESS